MSGLVLNFFLCQFCPAPGYKISDTQGNQSIYRRDKKHKSGGGACGGEVIVGEETVWYENKDGRDDKIGISFELYRKDKESVEGEEHPEEHHSELQKEQVSAFVIYENNIQREYEPDEERSESYKMF